MTTKVRDTDHGLKQLLANAKKAAKGAGVSVGVHAAAGEVEHKGDGDEAVTVLDVAIWNEFGLGVPERSFLRAWVDENAPENAEALRKAMVLVLKGQMSLEQALELLGLKFVGGIQKKISEGIPPPNAEVTIDRKGSSKPLVDTGQMRQSITYLVRDKKAP